MPRLSFWALGSIVIAGATYTGYYRIYLPQRTMQLAADLRLEKSKLPLQEVFHAYARLQASIEQSAAVASLTPLPASKTSASTRSCCGADSSSLYTNREKILLFCELQSLRASLLTLPQSLTTEKDLSGMFNQLAAWETQHCTELKFLPSPLTTKETLRSVGCLALYLLCFRVLDPMLSCCPASAPWVTRLKHSTASLIMDTLDIKATLTLDEENQDWAARRSLGAHQQECPDSLGESLLRRYITLNATHWIEEVGFWACPNNPMLASAKRSRSAAAEASGSTAGCGALSLLHGRSTGASSCASSESGCALIADLCSSLEHRLLWCGPSASATAYTTTYAQHWARQAAQQLQHETAAGQRKSGDCNNAEYMKLGKVPEVSLGYPTLSAMEELNRFTASTPVLFIPVGVSGLPNVLYADALHAKPDVRPPRTREEVYAQVQRAQFVAVSSSPSPVRAHAERFQEQQQRSPKSSMLRAFREYNAFPFYCRMWWGGVYGGSRHSNGDAPLSALHYHLGSACTAAEYEKCSIAASQAAERAISSSTS